MHHIFTEGEGESRDVDGLMGGHLLEMTMSQSGSLYLAREHKLDGKMDTRLENTCKSGETCPGHIRMHSLGAQG